MNAKPARPAQGFTLIELLVALAIVSLVAVLSWQGLDNVIRLTQRVRQSDDQWEQMRAVLSQMERDLRSVSNPRNAAFGSQTGPASGTAQTGSTPGTPSTAPSTGRERAADRSDVIVENDDNLDAVVTSVLSNTQRVQIRDGALELVSSVTTPRDGPTTLRIRWFVRNGELRREQQAVVSDGTASTAASQPQAGLAAALPAIFNEPGLRVRGIGLRTWIEGRGWEAEQSLGELLPPDMVQTQGGGNAGAAGSQAGNAPAAPPPSGPLRLRGVQVRLWLPSGEVFTRVFMLGQES